MLLRECAGFLYLDVLLKWGRKIGRKNSLNNKLDGDIFGNIVLQPIDRVVCECLD
jgi:hypothetical protein